MGLSEILVVLMLGMPAYHLDKEPEAERRARLEVIAEAVVDASALATCTSPYARPGCGVLWRGSQRDLALLLVTQAYWESRLAKNIHEGRCRRFECDPHVNRRTGLLEHRSRTMWQMQYNLLIAEEWDAMQGATLEATRNAAWAATKLLSRGFLTCRTIAGAISRYAGLGRCSWAGANGRVKHFEQLRLAATRLAATDAAATGPQASAR